VNFEKTRFEVSFDRPGVYRYVCTPHESVGMRGAVFVALE
jgi:plastocyanin